MVMIRAALLFLVLLLVVSLGDSCCRRRRATPPKRHGRWGSWYPSMKSCCKGLHRQERHCNNPTPAYGGSQCSGGPKQVRYLDCNECSCGNGGCQHKCSNYQGGYACSCYSGYRRDGSRCRRITCYTTNWPTPQNGRKINCADGKRVNMGTRCRATCNHGYKLIGHSSATCGSSGNWVPSGAPRCRVITCRSMIPPDHGTGRVSPPECTANPRIGTICTVTCSKGYAPYDMYGLREDKTKCNGYWTKGHRIVCKDIQKPVFTSCPTKEIVVYTDKMKIKATVSWKPIEAKDNDGNVPEMTVTPPIIPSSSTDYNFKEGNHFITYIAKDRAGNTAKCSFTVIVKVRRCPIIKSPLHGKTLGEGCSVLVGSKCIFECNEGYNMTGSAERECVIEEHFDKVRWADDTTKEIEINTTLETDANTTQFNSTKSSAVDVSISTEAEANKSTTPVGINAAEPNSIRPIKVNASAEVDASRSEKLARRKQTGVITTSWTGEETKCRQITCPAPPVPEHVEKEIFPGCFDDNPPYKTICKFECGPGYVAVSGSKTRMCKKDGSWSGEDLKCEIVRCQALPEPSEGLSISNKTFVTNESLYQDECKYRCKHGYLLAGPDAKKCLGNGEWSPAGNPFCRDISMPSFGSTCPYDIEKSARRAKRSTKVVWDCPIAKDNSDEEPVVTHIGKNPGDEFNEGYHTVQYKATDKAGNSARCMFQVNVKLITCAQLLAPLRGSMECSQENIYGSECIFRCNKGYTLRGSSKRTCEKNEDETSGYWSGNHTFCEVITCPILDYPENGFKTGCLQHTFGEKCLFYCNMGFKALSGSTSRTCMENGTWTGRPLVCKAITCPSLKPPPHGKVVPDDQCENHPGFRVTCQFLCNNGYQLSGSNIRTCLSKGEWNDNSNVTCKDVQRPRFTKPCPYNIDIFAEKNKNSARVTLPTMQATDNSGEVPIIKVDGAKMVYTAGRQQIIITAADSSGNVAVCRFYVYVKILRCYPHPSSIINGQAVGPCNHTYGSTCRFKCNDGYNMTGSNERTCQVKTGQIQGYWSGTMPFCKIKRCHPLKMLPKGYVYPPVCSATNGPVVQTTCKFGCYNGFARTSGITSITCGNNGRWDQDVSTIITCEDRTPPMFTKSCPANIRVVLEKDGTATANWIVPIAEDNTLVPPTMTVDPSNAIPPFKVKQPTVVTYSATDDAGNVGKCSFKIIVEDNQGPQVVYCPDDIEVVATQMREQVKWKEPEFKDNSNDKIRVNCNRQSGASFYWGVWNILCQAYDKNPNNKPGVCSFKITVKPKPCPALKPPDNGAKACDLWMFGSFCSPMCNSNYDFASPPISTMWVCGAKGTWFPGNKLPDCSKVYVPKSARKAGSMLFYFDGDCNDPAVQTQIKKQFIQILKTSVFKTVCIDEALKEKCNATNVAVECGKKTRRKRTIADDFLNLAFKRAPRAVLDLNEVKINFELSVTLPSEATVVNKTKEDVIEKTQNATHTVDEMVDKVGTSLDDMVIKINDQVIKPLNDSVIFDETMKFECSNGQAFVADKCVACTMGTYLNKTTETCEECRKGWYQEQTGQEYCTRCPNGMSTVDTRSKSKTDCREYCKPGSYSPTGLESCSPCDKGSFQNKSGQVQCIPCSDDKTTQFPGAVHESNCSTPCSPGSYSATGLFPCIKCDTRSYQPSKESKSCIPCDGTKITLSEGSDSYSDCLEINECDSGPCQHGSTCLDLIADYSCVCRPGYTGKQCQIDIDDCEHSPCLNNGTCHDLVNNFTCSCTTDFKGYVCQTEIERCDTKPCKNGATCHDLIGGFKCYCQPGYYGGTCDEEVDECQPNPCANGGTCFDKVNAFKCRCKKGYKGLTCEENVDECASNPCLHGAECKDLVNDYSCSCLSGFTGRNCEQEIDECQSNPCINDGTCFNTLGSFSCACMPGYNGSLCELEVNECLYKPCLNDGTCTNSPGSYSCACSPGFHGDNCESSVDYCASQPCANNADCKNRNGTFECLCAPGFTGETCDTDIDECSSNPCINGGICYNGVNSFTCNCPDGYNGRRCEINIDECAGNPCKNNGICQDGENSYTCDCVVGFTGENCETDIDDCSVNPCENNGKCRDLVNDYACDCLAGYSGKNCSINIDDCSSNPCLNYATCEDLINGYRCSCVPGFTGKQCEKDINDCQEHGCLNNATCVDDVNSYRCICPEEFKGEFCGVKVGPCDSFPCHNGAVCMSKNEEYNCSCSAGFTGRYCQTNIDDCKPVNPCKNNGICTDLVANYTCTCPEGFYGRHCENIIDHCLDSNCTENQGKCINFPLGFKCQCRKGHYGEYCEYVIKPCESNPCQNGGNCKDIELDFSCSCKAGFTGKTCKIDIDDCKENKCLNKGTCVDQVNGYYCVCWDGYNGTNCEHKLYSCVDEPCLNNGTCIDVFGGYKCNCTERFDGQRCQNDKSPCKIKPCRNGGKCIELNITSFNCSCRGGYTGPLCDVDIDECASAPCSLNSNCVNKVNNYSCICHKSHTGKNCEIEISDDFDMEFKEKSQSDYVEFRENQFKGAPTIDGLTIALWVKPDYRFKTGTIMTYLVPNNSTEIIEISYAASLIRAVVRSDVIEGSGNILDSKWHFIGITWSNEKGILKMYVDGKPVSLIERPSKGRPLNGSGSFILGQKFSWESNSFVKPDSFVGALHQVNVWKEPANAEYMWNAAHKCHWPVGGNINSWVGFLPGAKGNTKKRFPTSCKVTDECTTNCTHYQYCYKAKDDLVCVCDKGYTGKYCDVNIDECVSNPCVHGRCVDDVATYRCECQTGYYGDQCENAVRVNIKKCPSFGNLTNGEVISLSYSGKKLAYLHCYDKFTLRSEDVSRYECGPETGWKWNGFDNIKIPRCLSTAEPTKVRHVYTVVVPLDPSTCRTRQEYTSLKSSFEQAVLDTLKSVPQRKCFVEGVCKIEKINMPNCKTQDWATPNTEMKVAFVLLYSEWGGISYEENAGAVAYHISYAVSMGKFVMNVYGKQVKAREASFKVTEVQVECKDGYITNYQKKLCVACALGTHYYSYSKECIPCAIGYYQDTEGSTECKKCRKGYSTIGEGSQDERKCIKIKLDRRRIRRDDN